MAKIIGVAGIRLQSDSKGLAATMTRQLTAALREASRNVKAEPTESVRQDADRTAKHVSGVLSKIVSAASSAAAGFARTVAAGLRLALIGAAAGAALAAVTSLLVTVGALGGALAQASGIAGLLPAALAGALALSATLKLGLTGVSDAMGALGESTETFNETIKNLAPNAQEFLRALREVKPAFDGMRLAVQQRLFAGLADTIQPLAERYLPIAEDLFGGLADSISAAGREAATFALSGRALTNTNTLVGQLKEAFANLVPAIQPAMSGILDLTTVGSTFLPRMTSYVADLAQRFGDFMQNAAKSGQLEAFFERAIAALQALGRIAGNVFGAIGNIMDAANASTGGVLANLEKMTATFEAFTGSTRGMKTFESFFESMGRITSALGPVFLDLVTVIGQTVIPIIADLIEILAPVLSPILQVIGKLLNALRPVLQALAEAFAEVLAATEPFFAALAEAIDAALPVLIPIIDDIAAAMVSLVEAMVPLAPVFVELLVAILPILPPLIQMVADLMPQFIELVKALLPVIDAWVQMMVTIIPVISDIVQVILAILIPIIQLLALIFEGVYTAIDASIKAIGAAFSWLGTNIRETWESITSIVGTAAKAVQNAITTAFNFVKNAVQAAMNAVINGVGTGITNVVNFFVNLPGNIISALGNFANLLFNVGRDIINGLIRGLKNAAGAVKDFFVNMIEDAVSSVTSFLGIGSPSKLFHQIGVWTGEGLVQGIEEMVPRALAAAEEMAAAVVEGAGGIQLAPDMQLGNPNGPTAAANAAAGLAAGVILQQTNIMQPGADVQQFASEVYRNGARSLASAGSTLGVSPGPTQRGMAGEGSVFGVSGA